MQFMLERIRAEFLEMPGLRLTASQLARLCSVDDAVCQAVLDVLVDAKFLRLGADGAYRRITDGVIPPRPAKAEQRGSTRPAYRHG